MSKEIQRQAAHRRDEAFERSVDRDEQAQSARDDGRTLQADAKQSAAKLHRGIGKVHDAHRRLEHQRQEVVEGEE